MRILVLSQWYPPEPASIPHAMACDLVKRGHQVLSITGFPNYPSGKIYPGHRQRLWRREEIDGVQVLRLPLYPNHSQSGVCRALNFLSFAASASLLGPILCGSADVIWVYHPPLTIGIPAWWISLLRGVPFLYEIQDMWPETLVATGMMRSRTALGILDCLARFVYARAAAITVISPGFKRNLIGKGVPADKVHVIPNWADEEIYRPAERDEAFAVKHGLARHFNVMFAGNIGIAQGLENVARAAELVQDLESVQFVFVGDGVSKEALVREVEQRELGNVRFVDRQPASEMPRFFALADVLLVHLRRDPLFEITIPSKTLAYMACGRAILGVVAGDAARLIRDAGAGLVSAQDDPPALAEAVRKLYHMDTEERERMGKRGRDAFLASYRQEILVDRYEAIMRSLVAGRASRRGS